MSLFEWTQSIFIFATTTYAWLYHKRQRNWHQKTSSDLLAPVRPHRLGDDNQSFPSLVVPRSKAPLIGLFFGAGWCDDCWKITPVLEKIIQSQENTDNRLMEVVYVSCDRTAQGMKDYKPSCFSEIPFENESEISALKRLFGTCAKKELEQLGMTMEQRRHGTCTLIVIESASGNVLTEEGTEQFMKDPDGALGLWRQMLWGALSRSESWENLDDTE